MIAAARAGAALANEGDIAGGIGAVGLNYITHFHAIVTARNAAAAADAIQRDAAVAGGFSIIAWS